MNVVCPKCSEEFNVEPVALFKNTTLTYKITIEDGHLLQVRTFCDSLSALAKLLKQVAKDDGFKCEIFLAGLNFTGTEISATLSIIGLPVQEQLNLKGTES